jgi:hypothetical protein
LPDGTHRLPKINFIGVCVRSNLFVSSDIAFSDTKLNAFGKYPSFDLAQSSFDTAKGDSVKPIDNDFTV